MEELPSFFKVFLPSNCSERLRIPVAFVAAVEGRIPDKVFLRNLRGNLWPLKVTKDGGDFHFSDGWVKFVEDNSLEHGDFVVFDYDWIDVFYVQIFGGTACEKEVIGPSNFAVNEVEEEKCSKENGDAVEEEEPEATTLRNGNKGKAAIQVKDNEKLEATTLRNGNKGKAAVKVKDDVDVFEYGMVSHPKNAYFVTKLRQKRKTELYVPTDVVKDHRLQLPENLILLDEEGKRWSSKVKTWGDGRIWLTGGWKKFCKWNHLKPEDRCLCEFVHREGKEGIYLKMRILREGSWLPKGESQTELGRSS